MTFFIDKLEFLFSNVEETMKETMKEKTLLFILAFLAVSSEENMILLRNLKIKWEYAFRFGIHW